MTYKHAAHTAWQLIEDETIILNLEKRQMFGFNKIGGIIWQALASGLNVTQFHRQLSASGRKGFAQSISAFVDKLIDLDLIRRTDSPEGDIDGALSKKLPLHDEAPAILWQEPMLESVGQSCAFTPFQSYICHQAPFN